MYYMKKDSLVYVISFFEFIKLFLDLRIEYGKQVNKKNIRGSHSVKFIGMYYRYHFVNKFVFNRTFISPRYILKCKLQLLTKFSRQLLQ